MTNRALAITAACTLAGFAVGVAAVTAYVTSPAFADRLVAKIGERRCRAFAA